MVIFHSFLYVYQRVSLWIQYISRYFEGTRYPSHHSPVVPQLPQAIQFRRVWLPSLVLHGMRNPGPIGMGKRPITQLVIGVFTMVKLSTNKVSFTP